LTIITLYQSLSCDPVTKPHADRAAAEAYMAKVLRQEGWPADAALEAAQKGTPVLVRDNGDDETIEIRSI
jgi:hypothetical protein